MKVKVGKHCSLGLKRCGLDARWYDPHFRAQHCFASQLRCSQESDTPARDLPVFSEFSTSSEGAWGGYLVKFYADGSIISEDQVITEVHRDARSLDISTFTSTSNSGKGGGADEAVLLVRDQITDDNWSSTAFFECGVFSSGPAVLQVKQSSDTNCSENGPAKDDGPVFIFCLPYAGDGKAAGALRERLRVWIRYDAGGQLHQVWLAHERPRAFVGAATKVERFADTRRHSNAVVAGPWVANNTKVELLEDGTLNVTRSFVTRFYQRGVAVPGGQIINLPLGVSLVAPNRITLGITFYLAASWSPPLSYPAPPPPLADATPTSADSPARLDSSNRVVLPPTARPVVLRTYDRAGRLSSVSSRVERRPPVAATGAAGAAGAGADMTVQAAVAAASTGYAFSKADDLSQQSLRASFAANASDPKWRGFARPVLNSSAAAAAANLASKMAEAEARRSPRVRELWRMMESNDAQKRLQAVLACKDGNEVPAEEAARIMLKPLMANDPDPVVREYATLGLGLRPAPPSAPASPGSTVSGGLRGEVVVELRRALQLDSAAEVRAAAAAAAGFLGDVSFADLLVVLVYEDTSNLVRGASAVSLGMLRDPRAFTTLVDGLAMDPPGCYDMMRACIGALGELGDVRAVPHILRFCNSYDYITQQILAKALSNLPCSDAERALQFLVRQDYPSVRLAAAQGLRQLALRMSSQDSSGGGDGGESAAA